MMNNRYVRPWPPGRHSALITVGAAALLLTGAVTACAQTVESLCARVQIEIRQELAIERQGFDAIMRIGNQLPALSIDNIDIDVVFTDIEGNTVSATSDPNNTNATFFITIYDQTGIADIDGAGSVGAKSSAEIRWLIIPSPGAGGMFAQGKRYNVGATLAYSLSGEAQTMDVAPDSIVVRPMPRLELDYFLPIDVYSDDPFSIEVEPPVPFSLGVRVNNTGYGTALKLTIDSGQPVIVENELGLRIQFSITGSEVNGEYAPSSLLVDFGDINAGQAALARWIMETTLSGSFTNFEADFSHSDEFGGELTSLIEGVDTHELVHDVLVDLPGRDGIRDFLAKDGAGLAVYESEGTDHPVSDESGLADLEFVGNAGSLATFRIVVPAGGGPFHVKKAWSNDIYARIISVIRDDGKLLNPANSWISQTRDTPGDPFEYFIHLFDVDRGGTYMLSIDAANVVNVPPVLDAVGTKVTDVGQLLSFQISATDPNGTIPQLTLSPVPAGATFIDGGTGSGTFTWTPAPGQEGVYPSRVFASDAEYEVDRQFRIYVGSPGEARNPQGIPESLTNWAPGITALLASSASGAATVQWATAERVAYDVYYSDSPFGSGMNWQLFATVDEAAAGTDLATDTALGTNRMSRFYGVRLAGDSPGTAGAWGVIRRNIQGGYTMVSAPLFMDRRFDGDFGNALASVLHGDDGGVGDNVGDEVFAIDTNGTWRSLYLDSSHVWREIDGSVSSLELAPGQGIYIARNEMAAVNVTFTGEAQSGEGQTNVVRTGWNIVGLPGAKARTVSETFNSGFGGPYGASIEEQADLVVLQQADGSWRRLMFVEGWGAPYDGEWIDLDTGLIADPILDPGQAYYYFRQPAAGTMDVPY